jgi:hypothetical protein
MANKLHFTPEEWVKVLESVMLVSMAVSAADPNGLWGRTKEAFAIKSALSASKLESSELIRAVLDEYQSMEGQTVIRKALRKRFAHADKPADRVQRSLATLREVSGILDARAPQDAAPFKQLLVGISQKVAEASIEGGFMGFGGVRLSDAEKATLADIRQSLGTKT